MSRCTTSLASALAAVVALLVPQASQTVQANQPQPQPSIHPSDVLAAHAALEAAISQAPFPPLGTFTLPPVLAASAEIRVEGVLVGSAVQTSPTFDASSDVAHRAVQAATHQARERQAVGEDLMARDARLAGLTTTPPHLFLELTDHLQPIVAGDSWEALAAEVSPGLDGVALRVGDALHVCFPGQMARLDIDAVGAWRRLLAQSIGTRALHERTLRSPRSLHDAEAVRFYRFRSTQVARLGTEQGPRFLQRLGRTIDASTLRASDLPGWAGMIAGHLCERVDQAQHTGVFASSLAASLTGDPSAVEQRSHPLSQAMAALALARFARTPSVDPAIAQRSANACRALLSALGLEPPSDIASAAACIVALAELGELDPAQARAEPLLALRQRCVEHLASTLDPQGLSASAPPPLHGMLAWAAVRASAMPEATITVEQAERVVGHAMRTAGVDDQLAHWPWLAWAAIELAHAKGTPGDIPAAPALRHTRDRLWTFQLRPADCPGLDADLVGGIVMLRSTTPLPTWSTARPIAAVATMLGSSALTDPSLQPPATELPRELTQLMASLRFLRQLTADDAVAWRYADAKGTSGGVREAPWSDAMPVSASALTLLAACETIRSLQAIASATPAEPPPPGSP